ncbi:MAG TPA: DUF5615 family PIN-like protein [Fimbriimonadaceae bacterium]|nr:DUF5615 family PIN-like protein [Fimbriimonadaceae bacterium]
MDENLSPRLVTRLADIFPGSIHLRDAGLLGGIDPDVWEHAKATGAAILTKDTDFQSRALLLGQPPKVVLVRLANCSTTKVEIAIRSSLDSIGAFDADPSAALLVVP